MSWVTDPIKPEMSKMPCAPSDFRLFKFLDEALTGNIVDSGPEYALVQQRNAEMRRMGVSNRGGFNLPQEAFFQTRATVAKGSALDGSGGAIIPTQINNLVPENYPRSIIVEAGVTLLDGVGDIQFPRISTNNTAYVVNEDSAVTEGSPALDSVTLRWERSVGCMAVVSRAMLSQSQPSVEQILRNDMTAKMLQKMDETLMATIVADSNISETNGATFGFALFSTLVKTVQANNAEGTSPVFVTSPQVLDLMRTTARQSGGSEGNFLLSPDMAGQPTLFGYPVVASSSVPTNLGTGTDEHLIAFGDFSKAVVSTFGGIRVIADEYTEAANLNVRLIASTGYDDGVLDPQAFALASVAVS